MPIMSERSPKPEWDAEGWLADLDAQLQVAGDGYMKRVGADDDTEELEKHPGVRSNRTSFAMLAVGTVMNKLAELPGMRDHAGLVPLHDLTAALWELGRGGQPSLLKPVAGVGTGAEHISERWTRQQALLCVMLLESAKMKARPACRLVAQALAAQGHTGRKKHGGPAPLSEGTVLYWRDKSRQRNFKNDDPATAAFIERNLAHFRQRPDWPFDETRAVAVVTKMLSSTLIRSKSG
jgi:hypothetical protein